LDGCRAVHGDQARYQLELAGFKTTLQAFTTIAPRPCPSLLSLHVIDGSCGERARESGERERPLGKLVEQLMREAFGGHSGVLRNNQGQSEALVEHLELGELDFLVALVGDSHIRPREDRVRLLRRLVRPL